MREALDALIQLAAYRHSTPAIRKPRSTKSLYYPTRDEVAGGGRGFEPSVPPRLKQVRDRGMIAPQRRQVVAHRAAGDAAVVAAVEVRRQGHVRTAGFFPEPGLPRPIRFRSRTHRDPDLDPDLGGLAAGLLGQARLGHPDGISPSRMAEMLEVDKAEPKVRC